MRTCKWTKDKGKVKVQATEGNEKSFIYYLDTLFDWYPLNPGYDYLYSKKNNKMYIVRKEKHSPIRYGVDHNKDRINEKNACFDLDEWHNPEVVDENEIVFDNAEKWGFVTPRKEYTVSQVKHDLKKAGDVLNILFQLEEEKLERNIKNNEIDITHQELTEIMNCNKEDYVTEIFKMNNTENENYHKLGEIYTMLQLMRKIAE